MLPPNTHGKHISVVKVKLLVPTYIYTVSQWHMKVLLTSMLKVTGTTATTNCHHTQALPILHSLYSALDYL